MGDPTPRDPSGDARTMRGIFSRLRKLEQARPLQNAFNDASAAQDAARAALPIWSTVDPDNVANPGGADGALWFTTNGPGGATLRQFRWSAASSTWTKTPIDGAALQNVVADTVKAGAVDGLLITGATVQTAKDGKRVVLSNNRLNFYGLNGTVAVNAGVIEGVPNGAGGGGLVGIGPGTGDYRLLVGNQALPTAGSADVQVPGVLWVGGMYVNGDTDWAPIPNVPAGINSSAYYRVKNGIVYLRGNIARPNQAQFVAGYTAVGTLPAGARPVQYMRAAIAMYNGVTANLVIDTNGVMQVGASTGATADTVYVGGVNFPNS